MHQIVPVFSAMLFVIPVGLKFVPSEELYHCNVTPLFAFGSVNPEAISKPLPELQKGPAPVMVPADVEPVQFGASSTNTFNEISSIAMLAVLAFAVPVPPYKYNLYVTADDVP